MKQTLDFLLQKEEKLSHACAELMQNTDQLSRGAQYILMQIKLRIKQLIAKTRTAFNAACSLYNDFEECESDSDDMGTDSDDSEDDSASY